MRPTLTTICKNDCQITSRVVLPKCHIFSFFDLADKWAICKDFFHFIRLNIMIKNMIGIPIIPFTVNYSQVFLPLQRLVAFLMIVRRNE